MITVNRTIAKLGGTLIGTHPAGSLDWHAQRANAIGGSDIAPIMNKSPWTSAVYLWAQKSGKLIPPEGTMAMKLGNYFEPAILKLFGDMHRLTFPCCSLRGCRRRIQRVYCRV